MNRVFGRKNDPFLYRSSSYEQARLSAMEAAIGGRRYHRTLEVGCAEGDFTERLLKVSDRVSALDISPVALARARKRLARPVEFMEADVRLWTPPQGVRFDLLVAADVLYYMDRSLVKTAFEELFSSLASWMEPGGRLLLAHAFAGDEELVHRRSFRERFEGLGLRLIKEETAGSGLSAGPVSCLISVLEK